MHKDDDIRKFGPKISPIRSVPIPTFQSFQLDNGIPVYYINDGSQSLVKLDIVFEGGRHAELKKTVARVFSAMLKEGTSEYNSNELSEKFDYYGASYNIRSSLDFSTITLFSLTKHFPLLMELISKVVLDPIFPDEEIEKFKKTSIQRLALDQSKNDVVSYRKLTEQIFGQEAVYGYNSSEESYSAIFRDDMLAFYQDLISGQVCKLFLCGKFTEEVTDSINKYFGQWNYKGDKPTEYSPSLVPPTTLHFDSPNELQSALRLGRHFGNRKHEDYANLTFLSNVFGGYFGSRLMKNIREDKGFTYNIYSDIDCMLHDGYFYIATELAPEYVEPTLEEIYKEMNILCSELMTAEELEMNKNYILGNLLTAVDGPFQAIRIVKSAILNRRTRQDVINTIETFTNMTPEKLREIAKIYLDPKDYTLVQIS